LVLEIFANSGKFLHVLHIAESIFNLTTYTFTQPHEPALFCPVC